jgi:hypothetical protein
MTAEPDGSRPQDQGRRHRRKGAPSAATLSLLGDYQDAMRGELRDVLTELAGSPAPAGLLDDAGAKRVTVRPPISDRMKLWDLAIKLGRELGSEIDPPAPPTVVGPSKPRRARVDYG